MNTMTHDTARVSLPRIHWLEFTNECRRNFRIVAYVI